MAGASFIQLLVIILIAAPALSFPLAPGSEPKRESTKEILELEAELKARAGENKKFEAPPVFAPLSDALGEKSSEGDEDTDSDEETADAEREGTDGAQSSASTQEEEELRLLEHPEAFSSEENESAEDESKEGSSTSEESKEALQLPVEQHQEEAQQQEEQGDDEEDEMELMAKIMLAIRADPRLLDILQAEYEAVAADEAQRYPGYGAGRQPGYGTGRQPGYGAGRQPGNGAGRQPGYGAGRQPGYGAGRQPMGPSYLNNEMRARENYQNYAGDTNAKIVSKKGSYVPRGYQQASAMELGVI